MPNYTAWYNDAVERQLRISGMLSGRRTFPFHGFLGLTLIAVAWPASWFQLEPLGQHAFFPLWLGYILTVDALVLRRTGTSLLTRSPIAFSVMFLISIPSWWLFEGVNNLTRNWHYLGAEEYSAFRYTLAASWHFSIVTPAVFETAELVGSFGFMGRFQRMRAVPLSNRLVIGAMALGILSLAALLLWPRYLFPATWISLFLLLDPINYLRNRPSVLGSLRGGDWRLLVAMGLGGLVCGWFWEMWNYFAFPKWYYTIPFVGFARVFEMPLLGYAGYLPFGLEVYALYYLMSGLVRWAPRSYLSFEPRKAQGTGGAGPMEAGIPAQGG